MKVVIDGVEHDYTSDFPTGWKFAKEDYFKKVKLLKGNYNFAKRFESKPPEKISGWKLLEAVRGKNLPGLARVYDIVLNKEKARNVYYLFNEFIEGYTINQLIANKEAIDIKRLADDLFDGMNSLQKYQFWIYDFTEKNIFFSEKDGFKLIDLDSAYSFENFPKIEDWGDKSYWGLVLKAYQFFLKLDINVSNLHGLTFNYLHIIFLILRIRIYQTKIIDEYEDEDVYKNLSSFLYKISPGFASLLVQALQNNQTLLKPEYIAEIKSLVYSNIITLSDEDVKNLIEGAVVQPEFPIPPGKDQVKTGEGGKIIIKEVPPEPTVSTGLTKPAVPDPLITQFIVSGYRENNGKNNYVVESGKKFQLEWKCENAGTIKLYRNGIFYSSNSGKNILEKVEEAGDSNSNTVEFKLKALNDSAKEAEATITLKVVKEPVIKVFEASKYSQQSGTDHYLVEYGKGFALKWEVENSSSIELYKNNARVKAINPGNTGINVLSTTSDEVGKRINYQIKALNDHAAIESKTISIQYFNLPAVIRYFTSTAQKVKSNAPFTLNWEVENVKELKLLRNGILLKTLLPDQTSNALSEVNMGKSELSVIFTLQASNDAKNNETKNVTVVVIPQPKPVPWLIILAIVAILIIVFFVFRALSRTSVNALNNISVTEQETLLIKGSNLPTTNGEIKVLFENTEALIKHQSEHSLEVVVPRLNSDKKEISIRVDIKNQSYLAGDHIRYELKPSSGVSLNLVSIEPPPLLNEIWHTPDSGLYVTFNLSEKKIYYALKEKVPFFDGTIAQSGFDSSAGIYKLPFHDHTGNKAIYIKNVQPLSFECYISRDSNVVNLAKFVKLELYYEKEDPTFIYLPNPARGLKAPLIYEQRAKLNKLIGRISSNTTFMNIYYQNSFIRKFPGAVLDVAMEFKRKGYAVDTTTVPCEESRALSDPFMRNYITLTIINNDSSDDATDVKN